MTWIDYGKAYDSVPDSWILKTLQMYRFNEKLIKFMKTSMSNWKTTMKLSYNDGCITTDQIKILNTSAPISNLFYIDDLKFYSRNEQEQVGEPKIRETIQ